MNPEFNQEERELIKLVGFFKKRAERMIEEKKVGEEYKQLIETCEKLVEQLHVHAKNREIVLGERQQLSNLVKDNARCPKCDSMDQLKMIGTDKNEQGWKSNKYKCRKCNIEFVWSAPNNPWDMIPYVENFIANLEKKLADEQPGELAVQETTRVIDQMKANVAKLKPVVEASDLDYAELEMRETEMANIIKQFKKTLMIEKIKMED
ncbi:MAG: hypothetical protein K0S32_3636 [Bacteroidetes bacterium]|jgi:hypothetical protein|nr:hypothetical protein [Bacteroidota bacterium]